ncbi:hypothetical protein ABK040_014484 [Willaertia magna]
MEMIEPYGTLVVYNEWKFSQKKSQKSQKNIQVDQRPFIENSDTNFYYEKTNGYTLQNSDKYTTLQNVDNTEFFADNSDNTTLQEKVYNQLEIYDNWSEKLFKIFSLQSFLYWTSEFYTLPYGYTPKVYKNYTLQKMKMWKSQKMENLSLYEFMEENMSQKNSDNNEDNDYNENVTENDPENEILLQNPLYKNNDERENEELNFENVTRAQTFTNLEKDEQYEITKKLLQKFQEFHHLKNLENEIYLENQEIDNYNDYNNSELQISLQKVSQPKIVKSESFVKVTKRHNLENYMLRMLFFVILFKISIFLIWFYLQSFAILWKETDRKGKFFTFYNVTLYTNNLQK